MSKAFCVLYDIAVDVFPTSNARDHMPDLEHYSCDAGRDPTIMQNIDAARDCLAGSTRRRSAASVDMSADHDSPGDHQPGRHSITRVDQEQA